MTIRQLDNVDLRILAELQRDGRITFQHLSEVVGLSARPCLERVRHLERERVITGYTAHVDVPRLVNVVTTLVQIFVKQGRERRARFEQRMRTCPGVIECFEISGHFDYIAKIACPTLAHYRDLNDGWINDRSLHIERIESDVVLRMVKDLSVYPVELAVPVARQPRQLAVVTDIKKTRRVACWQADDIDLRILAALQRDGRATFKELSDRVGLTSRPCLERVRRLERNHIITNYAARVDLGRFASVVVAILQLHVKQGSDSRDRFEQHMRSCPQVLECFEVTGTFDYIAKVACPSVGAYQELTDGWINDAALYVERIKGNIVLRAAKDNGLYPIHIVVSKAGSLLTDAT